MKLLTNINTLNILLMLISMSLAIILPTQLFLLSYIILGPLHYLTEISWLKDRNFFIKKEEDRHILIFSVIVLLLGSGILSEISFLEPLRKTHVLMLYIVSLSIIGLVLFKDNKHKIIFSIAIAISSVMLTNNIIGLIFAIYLTTIIHVYCFTGMFILSGVLKSPSRSAILSFLLFLIIPCVFFILAYFQINISHYIPNDYFSNLYHQSFSLLNNITIKDIFGFNKLSESEIFTNSWSIALTRFFAFAYTYHYLNWFSKTKVIKWNEISKKRIMSIIAIWVISLIIYAINPVLGYKTLFLLSYSHVLLEFPLNAVAGIHIVSSINNILSKKQQRN